MQVRQAFVVVEVLVAAVPAVVEAAREVIVAAAAP